MRNLKKTISKILNRKDPKEILWALNIILVKLRKIASKSHQNLKKSLSVSQFQDLRTSEFLRFSEKSPKISEEKLNENLHVILKNLILANLKFAIEEMVEETVENDLTMLVFNEDLVFDRNYENMDFLSALIYILWQVISQ